MSRLDSREYSWYVLCVPPQRERVAERILSDAGFATFVPTRREWRFANKVARRRGQKTERTLVLMPRYLFLGMSPDHTPGWHGALKFRIVTGILYHADQPYKVPHDTVKGKNGHPDRTGIRDLMWKFSAGKFSAPDHHKYMQTHHEFEEGDDVISDAGFTGRVEKISGNMAKVLIDILGGYHYANIPLENLVKA